MTSRSGCDGLRSDEARARRACGFWRSLNARTNRQRLAGPRRPSPRQRASQSRRPPLATAGCCHRNCIPLSLVKAPVEMSGFVLFGAGVVCPNCGTRHRIGGQAKPHSPITRASCPQRPTRPSWTFVQCKRQSKARQEMSQHPYSQKNATRSSMTGPRVSLGVSIVYARQAVTQPNAAATCIACLSLTLAYTCVMSADLWPSRAWAASRPNASRASVAAVCLNCIGLHSGTLARRHAR